MFKEELQADQNDSPLAEPPSAVNTDMESTDDRGEEREQLVDHEVVEIEDLEEEGAAKETAEASLPEEKQETIVETVAPVNVENIEKD